jgi:hypothetical protein
VKTKDMRMNFYFDRKEIDWSALFIFISAHEQCPILFIDFKLTKRRRRRKKRLNTIESYRVCVHGREV